jgi:hypothetical protein
MGLGLSFIGVLVLLVVVVLGCIKAIEIFKQRKGD